MHFSHCLNACKYVVRHCVIMLNRLFVYITLYNVLLFMKDMMKCCSSVDLIWV